MGVPSTHQYAPPPPPSQRRHIARLYLFCRAYAKVNLGSFRAPLDLLKLPGLKMLSIKHFRAKNWIYHCTTWRKPKLTVKVLLQCYWILCEIQGPWASCLAFHSLRWSFDTFISPGMPSFSLWLRWVATDATLGYYDPGQRSGATHCGHQNSLCAPHKISLLATRLWPGRMGATGIQDIAQTREPFICTRNVTSREDIQQLHLQKEKETDQPGKAQTVSSDIMWTPVEVSIMIHPNQLQATLTGLDTGCRTLYILSGIPTPQSLLASSACLAWWVRIVTSNRMPFFSMPIWNQLENTGRGLWICPIFM